MKNKLQLKKILSYINLLIYKYEILLVIGSLAIFGAWFIQNFQENEFKTQKDDLLQKEENVNRMFDARRIWLESLYTHRAIKNDSINNDEVYFIKVYNYLETSLTTLSLINDINLKDTVQRNKINEEYSLLLKNSKSQFVNKEYSKISETVNELNFEERFNINKKFAESGILKTKILRKIENNEKEANKKFIFFYIFGSILIAVNFIISKSKNSN